ncbi:hypothetical protein UFOVP408_50 [uncultured Caudovirales phage]|uniref:Uncharacterized protein n=1 Tax=uncultured Caudovirales phage TaxID=2100421 RepID=A0A6J5M1M7_9CAUD|nr:hypothetical protein UFOVP356_43 [uncultured Caudovirales phage]CAB4140658.1 hypothetical protein UFOVP408_50 [uncultured Caudovirales phage]CAB4156904.1 hypothetical protein UFOVP676_23 [uncultured Caudovirales phage]
MPKLATPKPPSSMSKLADKPGEVYLPKSDNQKIMELKRLLIDGAGQNVVGKALQIALDDNHPAQAAMIKLCMDRMLPISLFEKGVAARSAVTINITGIGDSVSIGGDTLDLAPIDVTPTDSGHSHTINGAQAGVTHG